MKEYSIGEKEAGQKLHKWIARVLKEAPVSFGYKMLRKKNIVLNDKKASGNEVLVAGDRVTFYLADDTFSKFAGKQKKQPDFIHRASGTNIEMPVIYEDQHVLLYNKPVGMLSQKASEQDYSVNEYFLSYLLESGQLTERELTTFKPSICNRLDRNTSGLIICGKTMQGLKIMNGLLRDRSLRKYYQCIVLGAVSESFSLQGYLHKDAKTNTVTIHPKKVKGADEIQTEVWPEKNLQASINGREIPLSLLKIHLITGKPHQIRAHLSSIGHPIIGDYKYGNRKINDWFRQKYGIESQLLHAHCLRFPMLEGTLANLSEKEFTAPLPDSFLKILEKH